MTTKTSPSSLLLDTHVFIWVVQRSPEILQRQIDFISDENTSVFLSAVSIFEMGIKIRAKKLILPEPFHSDLSMIFHTLQYLPLPINAKHAQIAARLPTDHKDPFDRLLAAQAIAEGMPIMTADKRIDEFGASVLW